MHHVSIRTRNIFKAIDFYRLLDFEIEERFTTGMTLACWLIGSLGRIELIEIPQPKPAPEAWLDEQYTGYYHTSFQVENVTEMIEKLRISGATILLEPRHQEIGKHIYEIAFVADFDGLPIELICQLNVSQALV
jgi:catechol 2,3-dioxygenase-like lactoylglutathione lyase family enzyme